MFPLSYLNLTLQNYNNWKSINCPASGKKKLQEKKKKMNGVKILVPRNICWFWPAAAKLFDSN